MAKQKVTYEQVLEKLSVPEDTDKVKRCMFCGEYLHMIRLNRLVVFWIHRGEDVEKCGEANILHPGKPVIVQNMNFYRQMAQIWRGITQKKDGEQINGGNPKD